MSVEKLILATSRESYTRLMDFISSLVIKIEPEAETLETDVSALNYQRYKHAKEMVDTLVDYELGSLDYLAYGFAQYEIDEIYLHPERSFDISRNDGRAQLLLRDKRAIRMADYQELNPYYQVFAGIPRNDSEVVFVVNDDPGSSQVALHLVNNVDYPLTFNRIYIKRVIDRIIEAYPTVDYLKYLEKPIDPYVSRELSPYAILRYKEDLLDEQELEHFLRAYNQIRSYILQTMYLSLDDAGYDAYPYILLHGILFGTFTRYQNLQLERYSVGDYTKNEIYDILDSNNLPKLKSVDLNILRKVVRNLPELISKRASRPVFDKIVNLVADKVIVKRYWLSKEFATSATGDLSLDPTKGYEESVNLVFREEKILDTTGTSNQDAIPIPYRDFISEDDTWGGVVEINDFNRREEIREELRLKLLQTDFTKIPTKYITVTKVIELVRQIHKMNDTLALMMQLDQVRGRFMLSDSTTFLGQINCSPMAIWAALCWATAKKNGVPNPETIVSDAFIISDIMVLRDKSAVAIDAAGLSNYTLELGSGRRRSLSELIPGEDFANWLVQFDVSGNTTIGQIFSNYEANYELIQRIRYRLSIEGDADVIKAWEHLLSANLVKRRIDTMFLSYTTYDAFIAANSPDFSNYMKFQIDYPDHSPEILQLCEDLQKAFTDYIGLKSNGSATLSSYDELSSNDSRLNDLKLLIEEFVSLYVEMYKVEFSQTFSDIPYNTVRLSYERSNESNDDEFWHSLKIQEILEQATFDEYVASFVMNDFIQDSTEVQNIFSDSILRSYETLGEELGSTHLDILKMVDFREEEATQHYDDQLSLQHQIIEQQLPPEAP